MAFHNISCCILLPEHSSCVLCCVVVERHRLKNHFLNACDYCSVVERCVWRQPFDNIWFSFTRCEIKIWCLYLVKTYFCMDLKNCRQLLRTSNGFRMTWACAWMSYNVVQRDITLNALPAPWNQICWVAFEKQFCTFTNCPHTAVTTGNVIGQVPILWWGGFR